MTRTSTRTSRLLALAAGTVIAATAAVGLAGPAQAGPVAPGLDHEIGVDPCFGNPDLPACADDDDGGGGVDDPDLDFHPCTWTADPCPDDGGDDETTTTTVPEDTDDGGDNVPSAQPEDAVPASPNFTG